MLGTSKLTFIICAIPERLCITDFPVLIVTSIVTFEKSKLADHGANFAKWRQDHNKIKSRLQSLEYKIAKLTDCKLAILQQRSPSCGSQKIYRAEELVTGVGVTTALLHKNGLNVFSDDNFPTNYS